MLLTHGHLTRQVNPNAIAFIEFYEARQETVKSKEKMFHLNICMSNGFKIEGDVTEKFLNKYKDILEKQWYVKMKLVEDKEEPS